MTNDQLKAELLQALADNERLREVLDANFSPCFGNCSCPHCNQAKEALSNPLPTGTGAAMLRVVEDAKAIIRDGHFKNEGRLYDTVEFAYTKFEKLLEAVQALKELESK